jgi:hypothetical protein
MPLITTPVLCAKNMGDRPCVPNLGTNCATDAETLPRFVGADTQVRPYGSDGANLEHTNRPLVPRSASRV